MGFVQDNLEVKCLIDNDEGCTDKEKEFMAKWKAKPAADVASQLARLQGMAGGSMTPDLKKWLNQRMGSSSSCRGPAARRERCAPTSTPCDDLAPTPAHEA